MCKRPVRRQQFKTADFAAWLSAQGAEVAPPTNPYEVIRYRAFWHGSKKAVTHVVYAKESGLLTFTSGSAEHYDAFLCGDDLSPQVKRAEAPTPRTDLSVSLAKRMRQRLRERDGDDCWYCGRDLGEDATLEHLVPKSKGGMNGLANYVLAHAACNQAAADIPLVDKIELRARMTTATQGQPA